MTPLMFAAKKGHLDVVRTLVENGRADVNIKEDVSLTIELIQQSKLFVHVTCRPIVGQHYSLPWRHKNMRCLTTFWGLGELMSHTQMKWDSNVHADVQLCMNAHMHACMQRGNSIVDLAKTISNQTALEYLFEHNRKETVYYLLYIGHHEIDYCGIFYGCRRLWARDLKLLDLCSLTRRC